jgi:hypothetical protein
MAQSMWFYDHEGQVGGPVSVSELRQLASEGRLQPNDRVRKEDMERWVKARVVKGLFTPPDAPPLAEAEPIGTDSMFDFFGGGPPIAAPEAANEFHPAFDFFGAPAGPPAVPEVVAPSPPPARQSKPPRKSKPDLPPPVELPPVEEDSAVFQLTVPMAAPVEESIPFADVPMAMPASDVGITPPPLTAELTGPEVALQPDGTARPTGAVVELSVTGDWLLAKSAAPDGRTAETYLRLAALTAATLRDRGAGMVLSFHAGGESVAVECEGDAEPAKAFLRRVLDATG